MTTAKCPICLEEATFQQSSPKQVCEKCQSRTSDAYGRRLRFTNTGLAGGLQAFYLDNGEEYFRQLCYIDGVKCFANEHRLGGIVVEVVKD